MPHFLKVHDVAQPDTTTQFISDVQLSTFYDNTKLNRDLMQRFLFTRGTGGRNERKGTADLLKILHQTVTPIGGGGDNRFVFIATYGHGKSHLGLALANYFGAPQGSPELQTVLQKVEHALTPSEAQMFREYREQDGRAPFLVLILRGDQPGGLRDNFFRAFYTAIERNEAARGLTPPFWFDQADQLLAKLQQNPDYVAKANRYLAEYGRDLVSVRQEIGEKKSEAYPLATGAFRAVHGALPNIAAETALNQAVTWIAQDLCGPGKPYGGLMVLFDEFSRFVQDYSYRNPIGAPLQELLSGFSHPDARGKTLFVAFSQHPPQAIAMNHGGNDLLKEINRIPDSNIHKMQTRLEDVLGGVLRTDENAWQTLMGVQDFAIEVNEASETTLKLFSARYGLEQLNWNAQTIMDKMAKQCFPMHPLTTAFLSSVTLEADSLTRAKITASVTTVRSVLGFVQDTQGPVMACFAEPAMQEDGRPNWVLPTRLVDYYGAALGEEKYNNFKNIIKPDLTPAQQEVLKAMLLIDVAELPTRQAGGYAAVVANMTGLDEGETKRTLQELVDQHYIRYDNSNRTYSFWVGSNGAMELERLLTEELNSRRELGKLAQLFEQFTSGNNPVNNLRLGQEHEVAVPWGHAGDWAAGEVLLPASALKSELLAALSSRYAVPIDAAPKARGVVALVIPQSQQEADSAPDRLRDLLQHSSKHHAAPMLFVVAKQGLEGLQTNLLKLALLNEPLFKAQAQPKVGETVMEEIRNSLTEKVKRTLDELRREGRLIAPHGIQPALDARLKPHAANRIGEALKVVYELAYPRSPETFFTEFGVSSNNLNKAVVDVAFELMENSLDRVKWSASARVQPRVVELLRRDWGIVSAQQQVIEPKLGRVKIAWDRLDGTFSPQNGGAFTDEVLRELLQPPYGYDHNTLALLFAAWLGRNRDAVTITGIGRINRPMQGSKAGIKNARDFLKLMHGREIRRKDTEGERLKVQVALNDLKDGQLSPTQAHSVIEMLKDFQRNNPNTDADFLAQVSDASAKLETGLENQKTHDQAVDDFLSKLDSANKVALLVPLAKRLSDGFPGLTVVASEQSQSLEELQQQLLKRATALTEREIAANTALRELGQYAKQQDAIRDLTRSLNAMGFAELKAQAEAGLGALAEAKRQLEGKAAEAAELNVVRNISASGNLRGLRRSFEALRGLDLKSDAAHALADEKYTRIKASIEGLETQPSEWEEALDRVLDTGAAGTLSDTLRSQTTQYTDTPEAEQVAALQQRADALRRYFSALAATPKLHEPSDVTSRREQLIALPNEHAAALNETQRHKAIEALERLNAQEQELQTAASTWLQQRRERFQKGDLKGLEEQLDSPPRFLSEADRAALGELRTSLRLHLRGAAQEEDQLKYIAALPTRGSLSTLQESLGKLSAQTYPPGRVSEAAETRRNEIQSEMERLRALPGQWAERLATATDVKSLEKLVQNITQCESSFEGSPEADNVHNLEERARAVATVFRKAAGLHSQNSPRLPELQGRQRAQQELLQTTGLSDAQREALERDLIETARLIDEKIAEREQRLQSLSEKLEQALNVGAIDSVNLDGFSPTGLPEVLIVRLQVFEERKRGLRPLLKHLQELERGQPDTLEVAQKQLQEYAELQQANEWSPFQRAHIAGRREARQSALQGKQAQARQWLSGWGHDFERRLAGLESQQLADLQTELARPHPFLDEQGLAGLEGLRHLLKRRLQEDQELHIETLFLKIDCPKRRAALLQRLQGIT